MAEQCHEQTRIKNVEREQHSVHFVQDSTRQTTPSAVASPGAHPAGDCSAYLNLHTRRHRHMHYNKHGRITATRI